MGILQGVLCIGNSQFRNLISLGLRVYTLVFQKEKNLKQPKTSKTIMLISLKADFINAIKGSSSIVMKTAIKRIGDSGEVAKQYYKPPHTYKLIRNKHVWSKPITGEDVRAHINLGIWENPGLKIFQCRRSLVSVFHTLPLYYHFAAQFSQCFLLS